MSSIEREMDRRILWRTAFLNVINIHPQRPSEATATANAAVKAFDDAFPAPPLIAGREELAKAYYDTTGKQAATGRQAIGNVLGGAVACDIGMAVWVPGRGGLLAHDPTFGKLVGWVRACRDDRRDVGYRDERGQLRNETFHVLDLIPCAAGPCV